MKCQIQIQTVQSVWKTPTFKGLIDARILQFWVITLSAVLSFFMMIAWLTTEIWYSCYRAIYWECPLAHSMLLDDIVFLLCLQQKLSWIQLFFQVTLCCFAGPLCISRQAAPPDWLHSNEREGQAHSHKAELVWTQCKSCLCILCKKLTVVLWTFGGIRVMPCQLFSLWLSWTDSKGPAKGHSVSSRMTSDHDLQHVLGQ